MISPSLIMNTTKFSFTDDVSKPSVLLPHLGGLKSYFQILATRVWHFYTKPQLQLLSRARLRFYSF